VTADQPNIPRKNDPAERTDRRVHASEEQGNFLESRTSRAILKVIRSVNSREMREKQR
jgi:hypothetical protein